MTARKAALFVSILLLLLGSGCGWIVGKNIDTERTNLDTPVTTMTVPDQVKSEKVLFAHEGSAGSLVVTLTREAEMFDRKTDVVDRQVYQKSGYGKEHEQWPVWVDAVTGGVLLAGGGTALALGATQDTENDYEYRTNPDTGARERREVPNSSNQDAFYASGGVGVGVSIPFIISAIHNGVRTKDKKVSPPVRTNLDTEVNVRPVKTALAGVPVVVTLPDGTALNATADGDGRVNVALPDTADAYFPLKQVLTVSVPSKEARYDIPADADTLALLPPAARARADKLAEEVRKTEEDYQAALALWNSQVAPFVERVNNLPHACEFVSGEIRSKEPGSLIVWGTARCADASGEGWDFMSTFWEETHIVIHDWTNVSDTGAAWCRVIGNSIQCWNSLYYKGKTRIFNTMLGGYKDVPLYSGNPPGNAEKVRAELDREKDRRWPPVAAAKMKFEDAQRAYLEALPTDPYSLKK